jgi:hypothetical protein
MHSRQRDRARRTALAAAATPDRNQDTTLGNSPGARANRKGPRLAPDRFRFRFR